MDNGLIQTLFYILIIVFFLSSMFKKKHIPRKTGRTDPLPQEKENYSSENDQSLQHKYKDEENNDILEEVENLFKDKTKGTSQQAKTQSENENYSDKVSETEPSSQKDKQTLQYEDSSKNIILESAVHEVQNIDSKIEEEAKRFEQLLFQQDTVYNFANEIRNKIYNVELLKEYFILSEIIGKPKALRR
jgi:hypothetical protein